MEKLEQLRRNTVKAYQSALKAMFELVDAITEERNYYRDLCTEKEGKGLHGQFSEEYDNFIKATWYNSIDKTPEEGEEVPHGQGEHFVEFRIQRGHLLD